MHLLQRVARRLIELASQVGPFEKRAAIGGGAIDDDDLDAQRGNFGGELFGIERKVNGLAGGGVGRFEIEPLARRQAAAGAAQGDAGRGRAAQRCPRIGRDGFRGMFG